jgi:hypothetical protein
MEANQEGDVVGALFAHRVELGLMLLPVGGAVARRAVGRRRRLCLGDGDGAGRDHRKRGSG